MKNIEYFTIDSKEKEMKKNYNSNLISQQFLLAKLL